MFERLVEVMVVACIYLSDHVSNIRFKGNDCCK